VADRVQANIHEPVLHKERTAGPTLRGLAVMILGLERFDVACVDKRIQSNIAVD
jgi:hypothetical protein